jgi:hypothetical protein
MTDGFGRVPRRANHQWRKNPPRATFPSDFPQGLADAGYVLEKNVAIEFRWANFQNSALPRVAADLVERRVLAIVTQGSHIGDTRRSTITYEWRPLLPLAPTQVVLKQRIAVRPIEQHGGLRFRLGVRVMPSLRHRLVAPRRLGYPARVASRGVGLRNASGRRAHA